MASFGSRARPDAALSATFAKPVLLVTHFFLFLTYTLLFEISARFLEYVLYICDNFHLGTFRKAHNLPVHSPAN